MLEKLELKNFQSHKHRVIEFDPFVTTIVGSSDVGKSAVVRALQWVSLNQPSGEAFIRNGSKKAAARITIDGNKITRVRGKGTNTYRLNNDEFKAFGNDVPEPIANLLNIAKINYQSQHDSPFWFCETAGEISRQLNSIVDLEIIDKTLSNLLASVKKQKVASDLIKKRIERLEELVSSGSYVKEMNREFQLVESALRKAQETKEKRAILGDLLKGVYGYRETRDLALQLNVDGCTVIEKGEIWVDVKARQESIGKLINAYKTHREFVQNRPPSLQGIEKKKANLDNKTDEQNRLSSMISKLTSTKTNVALCLKELKTLKKTLKEEIGEVCPLCNQKIASL